MLNIGDHAEIYAIFPFYVFDPRLVFKYKYLMIYLIFCYCYSYNIDIYYVLLLKNYHCYFLTRLHQFISQ